jgi:hypothetical protein
VLEISEKLNDHLKKIDLKVTIFLFLAQIRISVNGTVVSFLNVTPANFHTGRKNISIF